MKKALRQTCLLINQELSILYDDCLHDIVFTIATGWAFKENDEFDDDDKLFSVIQDYEDVLSPLFFSASLTTINDALRSSHLFQESLIENIDEILSFREESKDFSTSPFNPYGEEDTSYLKEEVYYHILMTLRIRYILKDIQDGIQEYGFDAYKVEEDEDIHPLPLPIPALEDMSSEEIEKEAKNLLTYYIHDDKEEIDNLKSLSALCVLIEK